MLTISFYAYDKTIHFPRLMSCYTEVKIMCVFYQILYVTLTIILIFNENFRH